MLFSGQEQGLVIPYFPWCRDIRHSNAPIVTNPPVIPQHQQYVMTVISRISWLLKTPITVYHIFQQTVRTVILWLLAGNLLILIIQVFPLHSDIQFLPVLIVIKEEITL